MKALIPLLIVSTSALAVTTVQFAQRAGTERKRADDALAMSQKHEARIHELEKTQSTLQQRLLEAQQRAPASLADSAATPEQRRSSQVIARTLQRAAPPPITTLSRTESGAGVQWLTQPFSPLQQSPAAQRYMRAQMKASMRRQYEDIGTALGLSQEQANKLIDVLTDPQSRMIADARKGPIDRATLMQAAADAKARTDAAVAAVIGQDKLPQWEQYQKTMPERMQASMVREELQRMGTPISDDQRVQLVDILIEQHQLNPRPEPQQGLPPEEMFQASTKWQDESDKAFLERARSVLTKEQYEQYRDYAEFQREMRNNAFRNFRPAMPANQSGQTVVQGVGGGFMSSSAILVPAPPPESSSNK
jgi:hypothetical protein